MTRVTPLPSELAKLTRFLGRTVAAPKSNQLLNSTTRFAAVYARKELENGRASEVSSALLLLSHLITPGARHTSIVRSPTISLRHLPHATTTVVVALLVFHSLHKRTYQRRLFIANAFLLAPVANEKLD